jgi:MYXO-CTERM domain-containing protein
VLPTLDPTANNIMMVSTFNEWHEDTAIEPTILAAPTINDDSGRRTFTQDYSYTGYGNLYLDLLRAATTPEPSSGTLAAFAIAGFASWRRPRSRQPTQK